MFRARASSSEPWSGEHLGSGEERGIDGVQVHLGLGIVGQLGVHSREGELAEPGEEVTQVGDSEGGQPPLGRLLLLPLFGQSVADLILDLRLLSRDIELLCEVPGLLPELLGLDEPLKLGLFVGLVYERSNEGDNPSLRIEARERLQGVLFFEGLAKLPHLLRRQVALADRAREDVVGHLVLGELTEDPLQVVARNVGALGETLLNQSLHRCPAAARQCLLRLARLELLGEPSSRLLDDPRGQRGADLGEECGLEQRHGVSNLITDWN